MSKILCYRLDSRSETPAPRSRASSPRTERETRGAQVDMLLLDTSTPLALGSTWRSSTAPAPSPPTSDRTAPILFRHSAMATIHSLAPETLSYIFELSHDPYKPKATVSFALVCQAWRIEAGRTLERDMVVPLLCQGTGQASCIDSIILPKAECWEAFAFRPAAAPRRAVLVGCPSHGGTDVLHLGHQRFAGAGVRRASYFRDSSTTRTY